MLLPGLLPALWSCGPEIERRPRHLTCSQASLAQLPVLDTTQKLIDAARDLEAAATGSAEALKRRAAILNCLGRHRESLDDLELLADDDVDKWSQRAGVHLAISLEEDSVLDALRAAHAAARALETRPRAVELEVQAEALTRLGLVPQAAEAWLHLVDSARDDPVRERAFTEHQRLAAVVNRNARANAALSSGRMLLAEQDARATVRSFPWRAKKLAEERLLGDWAHAVLGGDAEKAASALEAVATVAGVLTESWHDTLLAEVHAQLVVPDSNATAVAHSVASFSDGMSAYRDFDFASARSLLKDAELQLERLGSPLAFWARHYRAVCISLEDRELSRTIFERNAKTAPERYLALRGQTEWRLGIAEYVANRPGIALERYENARRLLEKGTGQRGAAFAHLLIADVLDRLGEHNEAWRSRVVALERLSPTGDVWQCHSMYMNAAYALVQAGSAELADPFFDGLRANAEAWRHPVAYLDLAEMHLRAAAADPRLDVSAAWDVNTERWLHHLPAGPIRKAFARSLGLMTAFRHLSTDPFLAKQEVERQLEAMRKAGDHFDRLTALRAAARAEEAIGDPGAAALRSEEALLVLDRWLDSTEDFDLHSSALRIADSLEADLLAQLLASGGVPESLIVASDRGRRTLTRHWAVDPVRTELPPDADVMILVYSAIDREMVRFETTAAGTRVSRSPLHLGQFQRHLAVVKKGLVDGRLTDAGRHALGQLSSVLLGDLSIPPTIDHLVIVPPVAMRTVPFAGLSLPQTSGALIEGYTVSLSPDLALAMNSRSDCVGYRGGRVDLIGNPALPKQVEIRLPSLPGAAKEAMSIQKHYGAAGLWLGDEATPALLLEALENAEVVHYAGHATGGGRSLRDAAFLLSPDASGHNYVVTASDLLGVDARGLRLAVLSGCETAVAYADSRDGLWGLGGILRARGTGAVLATLAPVPGRHATPFVNEVHSLFASGECPVDAYRQAARQALADSRSDSWMLYQLIGG